jgi:hypothetical protein
MEAMTPSRTILQRSARSLWWLWALSAPFLCLLYMKIAPSPDQTQFSYMGWMEMQGFPFYSGSFDMNWPGGMLLEELAIRLFGPQPWAWHLFDFCLMELIALMAATLLRRSGFVLAPLVMLVLYPPLYVTAGGWMAGQRDIIAVGLLLWACGAMLAAPARELLGMILAGALVALAASIRPTYLLFLASLCLLELLPRRWIGQARRCTLLARVGALLLGFFLVLAAIIGAGLYIGNLYDFYEQSFLFTLSVYVGKPPQDMVRTVRELLFGSWHWILLLGLTGLALWLRRSRSLSYPLLLLIGLLINIVVSYVVQRKGFGYHLGGLLPVLVLLCAVCFDELRGLVVRTARHTFAHKFALVTLLVFVVLATSGVTLKLLKHRHEAADLRKGLTPVASYDHVTGSEEAQMVDIIRSRTGPEDRMVLYGTAYQVPYLAQRLPAYRFITPAVEQMTPRFSRYAAWKKEIEDGLRTHRPKFILLLRDAMGVDPEVVVRAGQDPHPVLNAIVSTMGKDYAIALKGEFGVLYQRGTQ